MELMSCASLALRLDSNVRDPIPYYMLMLDSVRELAEEFDILHLHIDQFHFPLAARDLCQATPGRTAECSGSIHHLRD
jgi:hypothetical protein